MWGWRVLLSDCRTIGALLLKDEHPGFRFIKRPGQNLLFRSRGLRWRDLLKPFESECAVGITHIVSESRAVQLGERVILSGAYRKVGGDVGAVLFFDHSGGFDASR